MYHPKQINKELFNTIKLSPMTLQRLKESNYNNRQDEIMTYDELINLLIDNTESSK